MGSERKRNHLDAGGGPPTAASITEISSCGALVLDRLVTLGRFASLLGWGLRSMPVSPNPYEPPNSVGQEVGWWDRLRAAFRRPAPIKRSTRDPSLLEFLAGSPIFYDGVLFFVVPGETMILHAAIALREENENLVQCCITEVQRVVPKFFWEYSDLETAVCRHTLVVRFIDDYLELSEVAPRVTVGRLQPLDTSD